MVEREIAQRTVVHLLEEFGLSRGETAAAAARETGVVFNGNVTIHGGLHVTVHKSGQRDEA